MSDPLDMGRSACASHRLRVALSAALLLLVAESAGCKGSTSDKPPVHVWQQMDSNQYYRTQTPNPNFADGRTMREPVAGTVARGALADNLEYFEGRDTTGGLIDTLPTGIELDAALVARGRDRFDIYCAPCHDEAGRGRGLVQQRGGGFKAPPASFHKDRLRAMPLAHFYDVTTHGAGTMRPYAAQIPERDRWAIAAWVRVLQHHGSAKGWND